MKGFIYLIINDNICKGYVGSTIDMESRMKKHKNDKKCMSREIICNSYTHEILEEIDFEELKELKIVEQKWIDHYKPYLVNKKRAYSTKEEKKEYLKAKYDANREAIKAQNKAYRDANRDAIKAKKKEKYDANREAILAKKKARYDANPDAIKAKEKARYDANRDARLAKQKAYDVANRDARLAKEKARYAKKKLLSISTT
jgi:hypothetical protein